MFDSGLWRIAPGEITQAEPERYAGADKLGTDNIRSVSQDAEGTLWIGTFGGGLSSIHDGILHRYVARDGLLSDNISHVQDDGKGDLWLSSPRGICRISKRQLSDFSAGKIRVLSPINYGTEDGLRSAQSAPGFPVGGGSTLTRDGRLWFPTAGGLAVIDPHMPEPKAQGAPAPITRIVELDVDGRTVDLSKAASFNPGTGSVQFRYAGIYLSAPERVRYSYRLNGLDRDWISAGTRRVISYNPLPHGRYRFAVRAMLPGGGSSESDFSFDVMPHFYETGWFLAICGIASIGLIYGVYQLRLREISGRFRLVLEERARLAREIHDTLAQGFVGISSQLDALAIKLDGDLDVARQHLDLARKMARHSLTEAKRSVMDLRTSELEDQDLPAALTASAHRWVAGSPVNLQLDVSGMKQKLPGDLEQNVLRIAQEAVVNALKHANARGIWIELGQDGGVLRLRVKDDGQGFEPSSPFSALGGHFGIIGMRERAARLGGEFAFASRIGSGTEIEVRVPLVSRNPSIH
jgi:two-component sensor histidine kinase